MSLAAMAVALLMGAGSVHAATFADMLQAIGESVTSLTGLLRVLFSVLGFACIGTGLFKIGRGALFGRQDAPDSRMWWVGISYCVLAGACLLSLATFGPLASQSLGLTPSISF